MEKVRFVYWQDEKWWLGYLEEYPDYKTQAESLEELKENLRDLYRDLSTGKIPCARMEVDTPGIKILGQRFVNLYRDIKRSTIILQDIS